MATPAFLELVQERCLPVLAAGLVLFILSKKMSFLPLYPLSVFALVNWFTLMEYSVGELVRGESISSLIAGMTENTSSLLAFVDVIFLNLLQVVHMLILCHQYDIAHWKYYFFGSFTVGHPNFWYYHFLYLGAIPAVTESPTPKPLKWAKDLLAMIEAALVLSLSYVTLFATREPLLFGLLGSDWLSAKGVGAGNLPSFFSTSLGERYLQGVVLLNFVQFVMFALPRVQLGSAVSTWALRFVLLCVGAVNQTLALSLFIGYTLIVADGRWATAEGEASRPYGLK